MSKIIELNRAPLTRKYTAEVSSLVRKGENTSNNKLAFYFTLTYLGVKQNALQFLFEVQKRFFLDETNFIVKKLSRAQRLALKVASLNDRILFNVNANFKLLSIVNADEIKMKWQKIKPEIQSEYDDMDPLIDDFEWQIKNDIQQLFLQDNFFNFFFADVFYHQFEDKKPISRKKIINNAIDHLDIPIIETVAISKQNIIFSKVSLQAQATIDSEHKKFPLAKIETFLGNLAEKGTEHKLHFNYKGEYQTEPPKGLIQSGNLDYSFSIGTVYEKTVNINFNLIQDEQ